MQLRRWVLLLLVMGLLGTACGQKASVLEQVRAGGGPGGPGAGLGEFGDDFTGPDVFEDDVEEVVDPETGEVTTVRRGGGPGGGTDPGTGPGTGPGAADRTGITDTEIVVGIHAPVTGAAPFPQTTFDRGKDVYWRWVNEQGGILNGRRVKVVFRNDEFNPQVATRVCEEMLVRERAFLLIGGGGADQITACAIKAQQMGAPYLSAGVNESDLNNLANYFALSMTYAQQSPLLAQLIKNQLNRTKVGIVVADTRSFYDAQESMVKALNDIGGIEIVRNQRINKDANQQQAEAEMREQQRADAQVVYVISSPTVFLNLAAGAQGQAYNPIFVGPGITSGLHTVAQVGCPAIGPARFLSPFPQLDKIDEMDAEYQRQYRNQHGTAGDDIGIAFWGLHKTLHLMFDAVGADMSRQSLIRTLEGGREFASGVFPPVKYAGRNHFGATQTHLLQADCVNRRFITAATFSSGF